LGFGKERIDALLALETIPIPDLTPPEGITIRRVIKDDGFYLASLSDTIWKHQTKAPRWHPTMPEEAKAQLSGWAEIAETPSDMAYLAFEGEELLGSIAFYVQEETERDFLTPAKCRYMTAAAIKETARGRGHGSLLTWYGLKQIRDHGDNYCLTNWQSANLLAARFWPRFGFEPVAYRLARQIHPSIAWAKAD
jgi:GNAT superfamily N-acetyltransferase